MKINNISYNLVIATKQNMNQGISNQVLPLNKSNNNIKRENNQNRNQINLGNNFTNKNIINWQ